MLQLQWKYNSIICLPFTVPQAIHGPTSQAVLEEAKAQFQEQLLRKAAQRAADAAMDEEQKRYMEFCVVKLKDMMTAITLAVAIPLCTLLKQYRVEL